MVNQKKRLIEENVKLRKKVATIKKDEQLSLPVTKG